MGNNTQWRVILCDGDSENLQRLYIGLNSEFEVILANNGMEALEKLDLYEPDLLIFDMETPGVDGPGAARAVRKNSRFSQIPIFFMAAESEAATQALTRALGIVGCVTKPVDVEALKAQLLAYIEQHPQRQHEKQLSMSAIREQEGEQQPPAPTPLVEELSTNWSQNAISIYPPPRAGHTQSRRKKSGDRIRVMILDDDHDVVKYMVAVLEDHYETIGLTDPVRAINHMRTYQPDIVLLDVMMPRLTGYQLSQLIQIEPELHETKIIFVTSRANRDEIEYALRLGATEFLAKPFDPQQLLEKVERVTGLADFYIRPKSIPYAEIEDKVLICS